MGCVLLRKTEESSFIACYILYDDTIMYVIFLFFFKERDVIIRLIINIISYVMLKMKTLSKLSQYFTPYFASYFPLRTIPLLFSFICVKWFMLTRKKPHVWNCKLFLPIFQKIIDMSSNLPIAQKIDVKVWRCVHKFK